ncbi:MAG: hypothetical protein HQK49_09215 [Oligoflexia bacterium]|nr:hypothetical protein [Oligoflexia bacterium]
MKLVNVLIIGLLFSLNAYASKEENSKGNQSLNQGLKECLNHTLKEKSKIISSLLSEAIINDPIPGTNKVNVNSGNKDNDKKNSPLNKMFTEIKEKSPLMQPEFLRFVIRIMNEDISSEDSFCHDLNNIDWNTIRKKIITFIKSDRVILKSDSQISSIIIKSKDVSSNDRGILKSIAHKFEYRGEFKNGKPEGKGRQFFENGKRYTGLFTNGLYEPQGKFRWPSGHYYVGAFKKGRIEGEGKSVLSDGTVHEGIFKNGKLEIKKIEISHDRLSLPCDDESKAEKLKPINHQGIKSFVGDISKVNKKLPPPIPGNKPNLHVLLEKAIKERRISMRSGIGSENESENESENQIENHNNNQQVDMDNPPDIDEMETTNWRGKNKNNSSVSEKPNGSNGSSISQKENNQSRASTDMSNLLKEMAEKIKNKKQNQNQNKGNN